MENFKNVQKAEKSVWKVMNFRYRKKIDFPLREIFFTIKDVKGAKKKALTTRDKVS